MRRLAHIAVLFVGLIVSTGLVQAQTAACRLDSAACESLRSKLAEYFRAIEREGTEVQKQETDFLIESCSDSCVRQFVALEIYDHYRNSPVMGSEAVAVHVVDRWFRDGKVKMDSDYRLLDAGIFADFNRNSLVGMKAPSICLETMDGDETAVPDLSCRRFSILYFYDVDCAKCKVETILLRNILDTGSFPVDLYAIYIGDDLERWLTYSSAAFDIENPSVVVHNLWDPDRSSDFSINYGVLGTPKMFLVSPDGVILGRGLDSAALSVMLHGIFDDVELEYGGGESEELFDGIFSIYDGKPTLAQVRTVIDDVVARTLERGDTLMFRQLAGDLLYYLSARHGEGYKEGTGFLIDEHILSKPQIWRTHGDSLKIVGYAEIMEDLLSKAAPGSRVPGLKLPGVLKDWKRTRRGQFRLDRLGGERNYIIFYTEGCNICKEEKKAADELLANASSKQLSRQQRRTARSIRVLELNVDELLSRNPALASSLFDSFDLSSLPFILETDASGLVSRRYITLVL